MGAYSIASRGLAGRKIPQGVLAAINTLLFGSGQQGAWYDPSDLTTLFQDSAGTVPVTAVEQPVGLMLDKSGRGNNTFQATSTKRPVYSRRVNLLVGSTTLTTQSITTTSAGYKLVFSGAGSVTLSGTATGVYGAGTNSITCTAGTLTLTVSGSVQDASFHLAIDLYLPYQGVNTATDYDADPAKFPAFLKFDGVDDAMRTGNIDFTGTDKMTVWAGVNVPADDGRSSAIVAIPDTNLSRYWLGHPFGGVTYSAVAGATNERPIAHPFVAGSAFITATLDLAGTQTVSVNRGTPLAISTSTGGGNFRNAPINIGADASASRFYFNGRLYSLIVRGAQSSQSQIESTELYVKQKMRLP